jgi:hypothetical protein
MPGSGTLAQPGTTVTRNRLGVFSPPLPRPDSHLTACSCKIPCPCTSCRLARTEQQMLISRHSTALHNTMSSDPKPALWLRCETKPFEHRSVGLSRDQPPAGLTDAHLSRT